MDAILKSVGKDDAIFLNEKVKDYKLPKYTPDKHYIDLTNKKYFRALLVLRHNLKRVSDYYFSETVGAKNVDLFMLTPSISSPMGPGSDSEGIPIKFGDLNTYLVDSSQFGFEPLIMNGLDKVYCYLPSLRGENPDKRHLNQFFHCEAEIKGELHELIPIIENYIKALSRGILEMKNITELISVNGNKTESVLKEIVNTKTFKKITFDEAVNILIKDGKEDTVRFTEHGRDISSAGELELIKLLKTKVPVWITNYDRDRVPFYQKPNPKNTKEVINADLIFPPLLKDSFGGEIVGCGQRQDSVLEMYESLKRQNLSPEAYEWYINLRRLPNYEVTSGFGLGVERFITWAMGRDDIKDSIIYPRLKNIITYP